MGLKLRGGELMGPHLTQCGQGRGLPACQVSSWSVQPLGQSARKLQTGQTHRQTGRQTDRQTDRQRFDSIGRTVLQTVAQKRFALCYRTVVPSCPVLSVCNVGVLRPNGWTDHDETWRAVRPWLWPYCVRWGPSTLPKKGAEPQIFGPLFIIVIVISPEHCTVVIGLFKFKF